MPSPSWTPPFEKTSKDVAVHNGLCDYMLCVNTLNPFGPDLLDRITSKASIPKESLLIPKESLLP